MTDSTIPAVLRERAGLQPDDVAFTYIDYDKDWNGVPESLTWAQLYRRSLNLAMQLRSCAAPGDRALILAPQGLDYVVGYLGALEANLVAVPMSPPTATSGGDRVETVLADAKPRVVLTTSAMVGDAGRCLAAAAAAPTLLELDRLDLDSGRPRPRRRGGGPATAHLQYTSGSTRNPAGVMVSHHNLAVNFRQMTSNFLADHGNVAPPGTTVVSWLPFYHDMGLLLGICAPVLGGWHNVFTSPLGFLTRPARWMQLLGRNEHTLSAAPNFAFDLATARTSDTDMAGCDLSTVLAIMNGAERVHPATTERFARRFAPFNLSSRVLRPSYGLAEATLFVATHPPTTVPAVVTFDTEKLSHGVAERSMSGTRLISYGRPGSPQVRIVDPETARECGAGTIGEIWTQGDNVCLGYWNKTEESDRTFGGRLDEPEEPQSAQKWLRTGDLGFISEGELFVVGRLKDLLIVRGRNHYPDDIEATVSAISGGRVAAIAVEQDGTEQLVVVAEAKSDADWGDTLESIRNEVTAAIAQHHGLSAAEVVLVSRGSLPTTTSGKIRRRQCAERYLGRTLSRVEG